MNCPDCNGRGWVPSTGPNFAGTRTCHTCQGKGKIANEPSIALDAKFFSEILLMPDGTTREIVPLERAERWFNEARDAQAYAKSVDRLAMELTAALCAIPTLMIHSNQVMTLVTDWRLKWDALQKSKAIHEISKIHIYVRDGDRDYCKCGKPWLDEVHEKSPAEPECPVCGRTGAAMCQPGCMASAPNGNGISPLREFDKGPWKISVSQGRWIVYSDDFTHDVVLNINGDFAADDGVRRAYAQALADVLNGHSRANTK